MAWIVARQFRRAGAAQALAYAHTVTAAAMDPCRKIRTSFVSE
jgi:hypothetical protein